MPPKRSNMLFSRLDKSEPPLQLRNELVHFRAQFRGPRFHRFDFIDASLRVGREQSLIRKEVSDVLDLLQHARHGVTLPINFASFKMANNFVYELLALQDACLHQNLRLSFEFVIPVLTHHRLGDLFVGVIEGFERLSEITCGDCAPQLREDHLDRCILTVMLGVRRLFDAMRPSVHDHFPLQHRKVRASRNHAIRGKAIVDTANRRCMPEIGAPQRPHTQTRSRKQPQHPVVARACQVFFIRSVICRRFDGRTCDAAYLLTGSVDIRGAGSLPTNQALRTGVCKLSEGLMYFTAWYGMYHVTPYTPIM